MWFFILFLLVVVTVLVLWFTGFADHNWERVSKAGLIVMTAILTLMCVKGHWKANLAEVVAMINNASGSSTDPTSGSTSSGTTAPTVTGPIAGPPTVTFSGLKATVTSAAPAGTDLLKIEYDKDDGTHAVEWLYKADKKEFSFPAGATNLTIQWQNTAGDVYCTEFKKAAVP